jgi:2-aminoadipate transaminase
MPEDVDWSEPTGGFLTWLTLPEELDTLAMRPAAIEAGVAYVPGPPFHVGEAGRNTLRLSFSHLTETELETAVERLATAVSGERERAVSSADLLRARAPAGRSRTTR